MLLHVWNLETKLKVAESKITKRIKRLAVANDSSFFVTVGNNHVNYWNYSSSLGRKAILSDMQSGHFCDVVCGTNSTYAITTDGKLCKFDNEKMCLNKSIDLPTQHAYCIRAGNRENLIIGGSNGVILIISEQKLNVIASLPNPFLFNTENGHLNYVIPNCIALCFDKIELSLSSIYSDNSFYVWNIEDLNDIKKLDSRLFHSSSCCSLDTYESLSESKMNSFIITSCNYNTVTTCSA